MQWFEKIGDKISSTGKDVAKKAKDIADVAKLNSKINELDNTIKDIYVQIGKSYFNLNKENPAPEYEGLFRQITDANAAIEEYRAEIVKIKGIKHCSACGSEMASSAVFCPSCGNKNEVVHEAQTEYSAAVAEIVTEAASEACPGCGSAIDSETIFCQSCGVKVKA